MTTRTFRIPTIRALGLVALLPLLAFIAPAVAETVPAWTASWIGAATETPPNTWTRLRKTFPLSKAPSVAMARIAVDSKYWLRVNGQPVVFEGGLKRGPNPTDSYFDSVDIARFLRAGENSVEVLAWYWGREGFSHKNSGLAGFLFQLDIGDTTIASDSTWETLIDSAYGTPEGEGPNFRLPESNIRYDARKALADSAWRPALLLGRAGGPPWGKLHPRPIPQWRDFGLRDYVDAGSFPRVSTGEVVAARLPHNAQVTPWLEVEAPAGLSIDIRTDNYRGGGEPNVRGEYITREGVQAYESLGWMNGQTVLYSIPAGVKILGLKYRETGYDTDFSGSFSCDDPFLDKLWEKARRTLYVTMRDNYMDCPDRERAQWWGDAVIEFGEAFYALSPSSSALAAKAIQELCAWRRPDGVLYSPIPSTTWNKELPQQGLASVGRFGFWTYYLYSGDRDTVVAAYPMVRDYLSLWTLDADGLVVHRKGDWDWADWGENIDKRVLDQAWYCLALQGATDLARLAGQEADAARHDKLRHSILAATNARFWNGGAYRDPAYTGATDDRANALCVLAGIAGPEKFSAIREILATTYHASPYMEKYVLESLITMGAPEAALARMKKRYADIVASDWTTLPELWEVGGSLFGSGSLKGTRNHAWSGGPLTLLSQYFAGLAPLTPAWRTFQLRPEMGSLNRIDAKVDSAAGLIAVSLRKQDNTLHARLESPSGTSAEVYLPFDATPSAKASLNGVTVWRNGQAAEKVAGAIFHGISDGRAHFTVSPGAWAFELTDH